MSDKKKILVYSPYSLQVGGGIETWIFYLAEYFNKFVKDAKLIIATNQEHNKHYIRLDKDLIKKKLGSAVWIELPSLKLFSRLGFNLLNIKGFKKLRKIISEADIIYIIYGTPHDFIIHFLIKKRKVIVGLHGEYPMKRRGENIYDRAPWLSYFQFLIEIPRKVSLHLLKKIYKLHLMNTASYNYFKKLSYNNIIKISPGIKIKKYMNKKSNKYFQVLFVGRLVKAKGIYELLRAIKKLNGKNLNINYIFIGKGPKDLEIKKFLKDGNIFCKGSISDRELLELYRTSHALVLPSYKEAFSFVIVESQSQGVHIITTKTDGALDTAYKPTTIYIPYRNPEAIANAIYKKYLEWKNNKQKYYQKSEEIRKFVVKNFSFNVVYKKLYKHLLSAY
ncbi:MAG: glycosyltransferase family 4 protein [Promethearchaeota archaeon]